MKKVISLAIVLTLVFVMAVPAFAAPAKDNKNQDFTGTPVDVVVDASDPIYVDDAVQIVITVHNIADRGLPQLGIWVNGVRVAFFDEVGKGKCVSHVIDVDTSEAGPRSFDVVVWTRLGNKNFEDILYAGTTVVDVLEPEPEEEVPLEDKFNDAIANGDFSGSGPIILTVDGVDYAFTSNSGNYNGNGTLFCEVDGVVYMLIRNNNGMRVQVQ
ncbi:MAG: hypothetical protein FWE86_01025 [Oscillospiraceae bacterium]|nr:hypothetical protein [Oscillospiraceae bacterium]